MPKAKKAPKPAHRPLISIDWDAVDKMLMAHCTGVQVAAALGMHPDTFYRRCEEEKNVGFTDYSQEKKEKGKNLLLQKQLQVAMQGNTTMLVWLGKQHLQQRDQEQSKDPIKIVVMRSSEEPPE